MRLITFLLVCSLGLAACSDSKIDDYGTVSGNKPHPVHGEEVLMRYGALAGAGDTNANGVGFARKYKDGAWVVTVNLNIALAPSGKNYTAYLTDSGGHRYKIGTLQSLVGDVRHSASAEMMQDLDDADMVEILLGDIVVAKGTLRSPAL